MTIPYLAQREDQQQLEWIGGSVFSVLLDAEATGGQLTVGRFDVSLGEAPPFHVHNKEDEVFLLLSGSTLVWVGDEQHEMFRHAGRDLREPRPLGFEITRQLLADAAELTGNVVLGPPR
jgi:hypothetical protein